MVMRTKIKEIIATGGTLGCGEKGFFYLVVGLVAGLLFILNSFSRLLYKFSMNT